MRVFLLPLSQRDRRPVPGEVVYLDPDESHHLLRVLRAAPGEAVAMSDGRGVLVEGVLSTGLAPGCGARACIEVRAVREDPREQALPQLGLVCGIVKGKRFDWALEKAVELGVHEIWPLRCERSVIDPGAGRQEHWEGVVRAAAKQAGRTWLPILHPPLALGQFLAAAPPSMRLCFGDEGARHELPGGCDGQLHAAAARATWPLPSGLAPLHAPNDAGTPCSVNTLLVWIVGPEGGWSAAERQGLLSAGAAAVRLGPHRLRTETAAAVGVAFMQVLRES